MSDMPGCPVCEGTEYETLFPCRDFLVSGEEFPVVRCRKCGLIKTDTPPPEDKIGSYYQSEDYISHSDTKKGLTDILYHTARNFMLKKKFRLISRISGLKTGFLLDIGSGTGYFPAFMAKKGWNVKGIEISDQARNYSVSKFGLEILSPEDEPRLTDSSFDSVTLWHVMEHLNDLSYWLGVINRVLKNDGLCVVALPNASSYDAEWFGKFWAAYDVPRHLWHFSPLTFKSLVEKNGFTIIKMKGMPLDVFYISILSYRHMKLHLPFARGILTGLVLSIKNLRNKDRYSSMVYVLKKHHV